MEDAIGTVIEKREVVKGFFLLKFHLITPFSEVIPGQFVMVKVPSKEVFLRRPFSIYEYENGILGILFKVVGKGTKLLSAVEEGEVLSILGPLGRGFSLDSKGRPVIVAGGIGIAGVHLLAKKLGEGVSLFFGCANIAEKALVSDMVHLRPSISTLDGSFGFSGNVVEMLKNYIEEQTSYDLKIYACGPEGMIRAIKDLLIHDRTPCEVLIEERMACGMGLCYGCVKKTYDVREPFKRVCKEGPVFDLWQISL
ncbi:MAG: dihydroorotate dehydrogenase electron transfer subunit [Syntrophorhabdaceae bacterium]|nr:dihydroorotate dehydrogenase electron transfer subunit [Syntrophorhabdaceae bacterium]